MDFQLLHDCILMLTPFIIGGIGIYLCIKDERKASDK